MAASSSQGFAVDIDSMPKSSPILPPPTSAPSPDLVKKSIPRKDGADPARSLEPSSPGLRSMAAAQQSSSRRSSNAHGSPPGAHAALASALGRSSPRHLSPATSQIFERDVQEPVATEASPAIPSHVLTEDHIPPVLEASSHAITENLDPDEVEIIQHASHQTAAGSVAQQSGSSEHALAKASQPDLSSSQSLPGGLSTDGFPSPGAGAAGVPGAFPGSDALSTTTVGTDVDGASSYGALNTQDPRRLSFISFADVVHAEHAEAASQTDGSHLLSSASPSLPPANRSPSPARVARAPVSPPRSSTLSGPGEASPVRGGAAGSLASATGSGLGVTHGEIVVESMRSALQKTGSNSEVGGAGSGGTASQPLSATSAEDVSMPFTHK